MRKELLIFAGTAAYTGLIAAIYWFVSYERAGTALLVFLLAGAAFFVVFVAAQLRGSSTGGDDPLPMEDEPLPSSSLWPAAGSAAAVLIGLGLIYGPWLWIPGTALACVVAYRWITELDA